jgi:hypothetical protein
MGRRHVRRKGGAPFQKLCQWGGTPAGGDFVLKSIHLRAGNVVDAISGYCDPVDPGGRLRNEVNLQTDMVGGDGGRNQDPSWCPPRSFIDSMRVERREHEGFLVVSRITIFCADRNGNRTHSEVLGGLPADSPYETAMVTCPKNTLVKTYPKGLKGGAGSFVDSIGFVCGPIEAWQPRIETPSSAGGRVSAFAGGPGGYWGFATFYDDEGAARRDAFDGCGGQQNRCEVFWTTRDRCVAFAESRAGGYWYAAGGSASEGGAQANALRICQNGSAPSGSCAVVRSWCQ